MARRFLLFLLVHSLFLCVSAHGGSDGAGSSSPSYEKPNLRSRSLILAKVWCLMLVFAGTFAGGISPYFLKWNEGFLVVGTQFAGGVFLGTSLMHFLSDANATFEDLTSVEYPFAFMLASAGYLLTMLADSVVAHVVGGQTNGTAVDVELRGGIQDVKVSNNGRTFRSPYQADGHMMKAQLAAASSLGDSILLIAALCFHSVFEGIAIGVAETEADAWKALWTISLHKVFAAVAMGIALLRMIPDRPLLSCAAYAFAFAISSPIGIAIGIVIDATTQGHVADWMFAISMGLACGVFVYVSVNHLLSKGYTPQKPVSVNSPWFKFLAVLMGIGVIAVVMIWDT